jgi:hypothetical protein
MSIESASTFADNETLEQGLRRINEAECKCGGLMKCYHNISGRALKELAALTLVRLNVSNLLRACADPGVCRGCSRPIFWLKTKNGKAAPYTEVGLNHFADCEAADKFRKPKGAP